MINKEGKLFGKVSIIDILVVIVILATAVGVYARFSSTPEIVETTTQKFSYIVKVEEVRQYTVEGLLNLGGMYDEETKEYLGEIVEVVSVEPTPDTGIKSNGKAAPTFVPEKFTVHIKVETDGSVSDAGYYTLSNRFIGTGGDLTFETKYVSTTGTVVSIEKD